MRGHTIFALSSGAGRAAIAVVRVSGPGAGAALTRIAGGLPTPRRAALRRLVRPADGEVLDHALVLWFPAPRSETGEDVAELQVHGGPAVLTALLDTLAAEPGLRPAEPGEFTRRAFDNGRLDLTAVEGLADLVAAETDAQRRQALRQHDGALAALYDGWRLALVAALAQAEAEIDFGDEDLPAGLADANRRKVAALRDAVAAHLDDGGRGERLRDGVTIVVLGAPNAGKSSLINALARREVAIVAAEAGTTRDVIEVRLDLGGYPATLVDTAGLRAAPAGSVEAEGIRRARARAADADIRLALVDGSQWPPGGAAVDDGIGEGAVPVIAKLDLVPAGDARRAAWRRDGRLAVSAVSGEGLDALVAHLTAAVAARVGSAEAAPLTRLRHRRLLEACRSHLDAFLARSGGPAELAAEELRLAAGALGRLTGRIDVEDVLDSVFAEFCIGK